MRLSNSSLFVVATLLLSVAAKSSLDTARDNLYKQVDFAHEKVYDQSGKIRDDVFNKWSSSEIKAWADAHGLDVPQSNKKDELKAFARRHSKLLQDDIDYYTKRAEKARAKLYKDVDFASQDFYDKAGKIKDNVFDSWSDSQIKAWADVHGLQLPRNGKPDELKSMARRNKKLLQDDIDAYAKKASKTAQPFVSKATEAIADAGNNLFDSSVELWKDSRLKQFLDARGVTTPESTSRDKLIELAKENKNSAAKYFGTWSVETWSTEDLKKWLESQGKKAQGTRDELVQSSQDYIQKAKDSGEGNYNKVIASVSKGVDDYKQNTFDKWSESDLKAYLDTYGIKAYQGTKRNELVAHVRNQYKLFTHGADPDSWFRVKDSFVGGGSQMLNNLKEQGSGVLNWGNHKAKELYHMAAAKAEEVRADL